MDNELIIKTSNISSVTGMYQLAAKNVYGTVYTTGQIWESRELTHELLRITLIRDKYRCRILFPINTHKLHLAANKHDKQVVLF